jgi:hypothetical protein
VRLRAELMKVYRSGLKKTKFINLHKSENHPVIEGEKK